MPGPSRPVSSAAAGRQRLDQRGDPEVGPKWAGNSAQNNVPKGRTTGALLFRRGPIGRAFLVLRRPAAWGEPSLMLAVLGTQVLLLPGAALACMFIVGLGLFLGLVGCRAARYGGGARATCALAGALGNLLVLGLILWSLFIHRD
jgi:hypothetical protein